MRLVRTSSRDGSRRRDAAAWVAVSVTLSGYVGPGDLEDALVEDNVPVRRSLRRAEDQIGRQ